MNRSERFINRYALTILSLFLSMIASPSILADDSGSLRKGGFAEKCGWTPGDSVVRIPSSAVSIPPFAFADIESLQRVEIAPGSRLQEIGEYAFLGCSALTEISLPETLRTLGEGCFRDCTSLRSITLPKSIRTLPPRAFRGCTALESIDLPLGLKKIGAAAFIYCESLKEITLPGRLTHIGNNAFSRCISLQEIYLPDSLVGLESYAFSDCLSLRKGRLPANSSLLGELIFSGCSSLIELEAPSSRPPRFDCESFIFEPTDSAAYSRCSLLTPDSSRKAYAEAPGWALFPVR